MKKKLLQTTDYKTGESLEILNITKAPEFKEKFFPANRVSKCSHNNRKAIIG